MVLYLEKRASEQEDYKAQLSEVTGPFQSIPITAKVETMMFKGKYITATLNRPLVL